MSIRIDWDAYDRRHLPESEMREIERLIRTDPAVRAEWRAFREFRDAIREAAKSEPVPIEPLRKRLHGIANAEPHAAPPLWSGFRLAAVGFALLAVWMIVWWTAPMRQDPLQVAVGPEIDANAARDEAAGARWIQDELGFHDMPTVQIEDRNTRFVIARRGQDWACLDYVRGNQTLRLYIRRDLDALKRARFTNVNGREVAMGSGVGWCCGAYSLVLTGDTNAALMSLVPRVIPHGIKVST
jgi:hypothetical protein